MQCRWRFGFAFRNRTSLVFRTCCPLLLALCATSTAHATGGDLIWAKSLGGSAECRTFDVASDAVGNCYVLGGIYGGTVDLDPGPGVVTRSSSGSTVFVVKLDAAGNYLWDREWSLSWWGATDQLLSLAVDTAGNVYLGGVYSSTRDFDPSSGTAYLTPASPSQTGNSGFIVKLDCNGNFRWARSIGASVAWYLTCMERQLAVDPYGNVVLIGEFTASADFDPSPGMAVLEYHDNPTHSNVFIVKFDPDGNLIWARSLEGAPDQSCQETPKVTADAEGGIVLTIPHRIGFDVDPGPGVVQIPDADQSLSTAIVKLDAAGHFVWARVLSGNGNDYCLDVSARNGTDIVLAGNFCGTLDFDPGSGEAFRSADTPPNYAFQTYLLKLNGSGAFCWVKTMAGGEFSLAHSVTTDTDGNVYAAGLYTSETPFLDDYALPLPDSYGQPFLMKASPTGDLEWIRLVGTRSRNGFCYDSAFVATGPDNSVYMTKPFYESADFDSGPGTAFLANSATTGLNSSALLKFDGGTGSETEQVSVQLSTSVAAPAEVSPIPMTVTFSAPVTGFEASDLLVNNGSVSHFAGSGATYTFDLVPLSAGLVTVNIDAGAAQDGSGRDTLAALPFQIAYMPLPPNHDSDGDGIPDAWETFYGLDPHGAGDAGQDSDGDGLTALQEYRCGGAPNMEDTDGDGYWDGIEQRAGSGVAETADVPAPPVNGDLDRNGRTDAVDVQIVVNAALSRPGPCPGDLSGDGKVQAQDVQMVINFALGRGV